MTGFRSGEAACGHCPMSLRCWRGKSLFVEKNAGTIQIETLNGPVTKDKRHTNVYSVAYCPRCFCVHFCIGSQRYLCGLLRRGITAPPGYKNRMDPVYHAVGGKFRQGTQTSGCGRDARGQRRKEWPGGFLDEVERGLRQMPVMGRDGVGREVHEVEWLDSEGNLVEFEDWDCFDEFAKMLTEIF